MIDNKMDYVRVSFERQVGTVMLDNAARRNALSEQLIDEAIEALDRLEELEARVIIIRAAPGVKVWSAGHDINDLPIERRDPLGYGDPLARLLRRVQDFPQPVIAMVEGGVWGGACDLCISCDIVLAADNATFAITPAKLGLPYNASGLIRFLNVFGPQKAKEMFFTAEPITAQEAHELRFVNHVVPLEELESFTQEFVARITRNAPLAVRVLKQQFRLLMKGQMLSSETFENIQSMRRVVYDSEDYQEGIRSFKEKRKPEYKGK